MTARLWGIPLPTVWCTFAAGTSLPAVKHTQNLICTSSSLRNLIQNSSRTLSQHRVRKRLSLPLRQPKRRL